MHIFWMHAFHAVPHSPEMESPSTQHSAWHTWWAHSIFGEWIPTIPILQMRELRAWQRRHFPKWHSDKKQLLTSCSVQSPNRKDLEALLINVANSPAHSYSQEIAPFATGTMNPAFSLKCFVKLTTCVRCEVNFLSLKWDPEDGGIGR